MLTICRLTLIALTTPTLGLATDAGMKSFSLKTGYFTQSGSLNSGINKWNVDSSGYSIVGNVDAMEHVMIGGSYLSGTATVGSADFDQTQASLAAGFIISNNLNRSEGKGYKAGLGISFSAAEMFYPGGYLETNGTEVYWQSVFGMVKSVSGSVAISAPIDKFGKYATGSIGATYNLNDSHGINLQYNFYSAVDKYDVSTKSSLSGLTLSYVFLN